VRLKGRLEEDVGATQRARRDPVLALGPRLVLVERHGPRVDASGGVVKAVGPPVTKAASPPWWVPSPRPLFVLS